MGHLSEKVREAKKLEALKDARKIRARIKDFQSVGLFKSKADERRLKSKMSTDMNRGSAAAQGFIKAIESGHSLSSARRSARNAENKAVKVEFVKRKKKPK